MLTENERILLAYDDLRIAIIKQSIDDYKWAIKTLDSFMGKYDSNLNWYQRDKLGRAKRYIRQCEAFWRSDWIKTLNPCRTYKGLCKIIEDATGYRF